MEAPVYNAEDYCRIQVLVRPFGPPSVPFFKHLMQRLKKLEVIEVCDTPPRLIFTNFITQFNSDSLKFVELQAHRRVCGLIGVAEIGAETASLSEVKGQYQATKTKIGPTLIDARCVLFGLADDAAAAALSPEFLSCQRVNEESLVVLEREIRELIRSLCTVIESRRLDVAFEKADSPVCPQLPAEEKYSIGTEQLKSSRYKKKCVGRLRKQVADHALLGGMPSAALDAYQSSIEALKHAQDFLWLAAAYEGWCCCAMIVRYGDRLLESLSREAGALRRASIAASRLTHPAYRRTSPTTPSRANGAVKGGVERTGHKYHLGVSLKHHQRYRSDEAVNVALTSPAMSPSPVGCNLPSGSFPATPDDAGDDSDEAGDTAGGDKSDSTPTASDQSRAASKLLSPLQSTASRLKKPLLNFFHSANSGGNSSSGKFLAPPPPAIPPSDAFNPYTRSASAANLKTLSLPHNANSSLAPKCDAMTESAVSTAAQSLSYQEIADRFRLALEHYEKYSFAVQLEYECAMRILQLLIINRAYLPAESFIRERMGRYLDDNFGAFDNSQKSKICLNCAQVYSKIGFRRKHAFYLRLAVLFYLGVDDATRPRNAADYKIVYPLLFRSLRGYGVEVDSVAEAESQQHLIGSPWRKLSTLASRPHLRSVRPFRLQVKTVYEAFTAANRAGHHDIAIRLLCFVLEHYYNTIEPEGAEAKLTELRELVGRRPDVVHSLALPLSLMDPSGGGDLVLPPLQMTRFPQIRNFSVAPLPPHLAPAVIELPDASTAAANRIFIYSPFQQRNRNEAHRNRGTVWVVNCACEVVVEVNNPLPRELVVSNLCLLTDGCQFESVPVRLNLAPNATNTPTTIKLLGVPREPGRLQITGYSCEVLGVRNVCNFRHLPEALARSQSDKSRGLTAGHRPTTHGEQHDSKAAADRYSVEVLRPLPILKLETSMSRALEFNDDDGTDGEQGIAECTVFSGQSATHTIHIRNSSDTIGIRHVSIEIQQPEVRGGPRLIELLPLDGGESGSKNADNAEGPSKSSPTIPSTRKHSKSDQHHVTHLDPYQGREVRICVFGIDPSAAAGGAQVRGNARTDKAKDCPKPSARKVAPAPPSSSSSSTLPVVEQSQLGEEHRVYVRRATTLSVMTNTSVEDQSPHNYSLATPQSGPKGADYSPSASLRVDSPLPADNDCAATTPLLQQSSASGSETASKRSDPAEERSVLSGHSGEGTGYVSGGSAAIASAAAAHDLIPYTGRLLSTSIAFTYTADVEGPNGEQYERTLRLPLAIAIVPAVNVTDWHILPGDSPNSRYVVVDVTNMTDVDAELTYGGNESRTMWVQPKEGCRVPLLCPCCSDIQSSAFHSAAQRASHMMQMREIEALRRRLEQHVSRYLEVRWRIPALGLDGHVPMGNLLSSVSFLKQLVVPALSLSIRVNHRVHTSEVDVVAGIGELIPVEVRLHCSLPQGSQHIAVSGELSLHCYQDLQNGHPPVDRSENMVVCGPTRVPFAFAARGAAGSETDFEARFALLFRYEGLHKVKPELRGLTARAIPNLPTTEQSIVDRVPTIANSAQPTTIREDDVFIPVVSFVVTNYVCKRETPSVMASTYPLTGDHKQQVKDPTPTKPFIPSNSHNNYQGRLEEDELLLIMKTKSELSML